MARKASMTFTRTPRGYTSVRNCSQWLEPEFLSQARALGDFLELSLNKLTKAQLVAFLAEAGKDEWIGQSKRMLVCAAYNAQWAAWYPRREV